MTNINGKNVNLGVQNRQARHYLVTVQVTTQYEIEVEAPSDEFIFSYQEDKGKYLSLTTQNKLHFPEQYGDVIEKTTEVIEVIEEVV